MNNISRFFALCTLLLLTSGCLKYSTEIHNSLKHAYGRDFAGYAFRGTPVGNFGVGTMYLNDIQRTDTPVEEQWLVGHPNTWFAETVDNQEKTALLNKIIEAGSLGSASLKENISRKLDLGLTIPAIREILSLEPSVSTEKGVKVTLKATEAINHRMNWSEFQAALRNGKLKPEIGQHVQKRDFIIAADDIVLSGYTAVVEIDSKVNPSLNAQLNGAVGKVLGQDTSMKVKVSSSHSGTFEVQAINSVVAAVLFKAPPPAATLAEAGLESWPTVTLTPERLMNMDEVLNRR